MESTTDRMSLFLHSGDESADRMEGCDANNISAALADSNGTSVDESSANDYRPSFPLLETIAEETTEELLLDSAAEGSDSPNSNSGRWGWGWGWLNTSDDDSSSVIHVPVDGTSSTAITSGSPTNQFQSDDLISGIACRAILLLFLFLSKK